MVRFLIDMDGVIADFEKGFLDDWRTAHPDKFFIPLNQRTTFYARDQYPKEFRGLMEEIYTQEGFFLDLPVIGGSREALGGMVSEGAEVYICTSPLSNNFHCVSEKLAWMEKNFGPEWKKRTIIMKDKTFLRADYLIDDRPTIKGIEDPTGEHIHYAQQYNKGLPNRRITWDNWQEVISPIA